MIHVSLLVLYSQAAVKDVGQVTVWNQQEYYIITVVSKRIRIISYMYMTVLQPKLTSTD